MSVNQTKTDVANVLEAIIEYQRERELREQIRKEKNVNALNETEEQRKLTEGEAAESIEKNVNALSETEEEEPRKLSWMSSPCSTCSETWQSYSPKKEFSCGLESPQAGKNTLVDCKLKCESLGTDYCRGIDWNANRSDGYKCYTVQMTADEQKSTCRFHETDSGSTNQKYRAYRIEP
jgi:hypothetical protein